MVNEIVVNRWILKALNSTNVKIFPIDELTVSEVATPCLRKSYYQRIRAVVPSPVEFLKMVGNDLHLKLQDVLRSEGYSIEMSISIKIGEFKLLGRIDAVKEDGEDPHIIEFKTVQELPHEPFESHVLQIQAYLLATNLEKGYIVYLSRKDGKVKVFKVAKDRKALKKLIERAKQLYEALKNKQTPPPFKGPW